MRLFYPNQTYLSCGNGCNTKLQALTYDEDLNPVDVDWVEMQRIYSEHNANCTSENPYTTDQNGFYGNPDDCYQNEGGYCEY